MSKSNCWEFKKCGREPGGAKEAELGVCRAASLTPVDGVNGGAKAGRACWAVAGTLCGGEIQGTFAAKYSSCSRCDFYQLVVTEQGQDFVGTSGIRRALSRS